MGTLIEGYYFTKEQGDEIAKYISYLEKFVIKNNGKDYLRDLMVKFPNFAIHVNKIEDIHNG